MRIPSLVGHLPVFILRKAIQRPKTTVTILLTVLPTLFYFILWRLQMGKYGRWYWNYAVALHPSLTYVVPSGSWGPIEGPPRWVQEIHDAPWMGEWEIPALSAPIYHHALLDTGEDEQSSESQLISPVIVKLHVFSTVSAVSQEKRRLIRRLSPLHNIPQAYRHLVEFKFVLGHAFKENWDVDEEMEASLSKEQEEHGDLLRLNLARGENLREGKLLDWIKAVGSGEDGGREAWWLFKCDDDTVLNFPVFLDALLELDPHDPHYLGTSLNRWPAYHYHFTGMLTGFSWGLVKTLAAGISNMSRSDIEAWWDDDVLTGELMFCLPSAPQCRTTSSEIPSHISEDEDLFPEDVCDPRAPPPYGWLAPPLSPDPRTDLIRYDFLRRMGDKEVWFIKGDVARHSWWFKFLDGYEKEWKKRIKGKMWDPPRWLDKYADKGTH